MRTSRCLPAKPARLPKVSKERWLVYLMVFMLVSDVSADDEFVNADGGDKIAPRPQRAFVVQASRALNLLLHPCTALSFQYLHDVVG